MTGAAMDTQLGVEDLRDHRSSRKTIAARPRLTLNKQGTEQIGTLYLGTTIDWIYMQNIGPLHIFEPLYMISNTWER